MFNSYTGGYTQGYTRSYTLGITLVAWKLRETGTHVSFAVSKYDRICHEYRKERENGYIKLP